MSQSSQFESAAKEARAVYEMMGTSGKSYVFFFFADGSITAAKKVSSTNRAAARLDFDKVNVKAALRDCLLETVDGNTYQKGQALLKELEKKRK